MKIFLVGFMGSGKSHWGQQLSEKIQLPFFDLDEQIESSEGKLISEIFSEYGEEYFRILEKDTLHIITESHDSFIMATGGGTPCYFNNIDYMNQSGTSVWINTPIEVLTERLSMEKQKRPLIKDLDEAQVRGFIIKKFSDRKIYYQMANVRIDEESKTIDIILEKIFHA